MVPVTLDVALLEIENIGPNVRVCPPLELLLPPCEEVVKLLECRRILFPQHDAPRAKFLGQHRNFHRCHEITALKKSRARSWYVKHVKEADPRDTRVLQGFPSPFSNPGSSRTPAVLHNLRLRSMQCLAAHHPYRPILAPHGRVAPVGGAAPNLKPVKALGHGPDDSGVVKRKIVPR